MSDNLTIFGNVYEGVNTLTFTDTNNQSKVYINTADANATAEDIVSGKTAYVQGNKVVGTGGGGGGGEISVQSLSVTENGTYTAPSGKAYSPVTVDVPQGGVTMLTEAQWDALSTEQKQAYGLVAIEQMDSGYMRGMLVNGSDYYPFKVLNTGTGATSAAISITKTGTYSCYVIAMNSEATSYNLNLAASQNGIVLTDSLGIYHGYETGGPNRRNYRLSRFDFTANANDTIDIALTNYSYYSAICYAVVECPHNMFDKALTSADAATIGYNTNSGMVIYGMFNGSDKSGTINVRQYMTGTEVDTGNPGYNYKSSYIFWFV